MCRRKRSSNDFERLNQEYISAEHRSGAASGMFMPILQALIGVAFLIVLWAGGAGCWSGSISLGNFVMFNMYMGMLVWPMIALGWVVNLMQRGTASLARIDEVMQQRPAIAAPERPHTCSKRCAVKSNFGVSRCVMATASALDGVPCAFPQDRPSPSSGIPAAARARWLHLIPRHDDPTSGAVLVDGHDVREYSIPQELRGQIGFVPQETFLFSAYARGQYRIWCYGCDGGDRSAGGRYSRSGLRYRRISQRL